jgi:hypothetical protein
MSQLIAEITAHIKRAAKLSMIPVIRLNGTSDISWENIRHDGRTIFEYFTDVQFYDYTKVTSRLAVKRPLPENYFLAVSWSGANEVYRLKAEHAHAKHGAPLVVVVRDESQKLEYMRNNTLAIDGDVHDLIFMHGPKSIIVLRAKGKAKKDNSGFVLDYVHATDAAIAA